MNRGFVFLFILPAESPPFPDLEPAAAEEEPTPSAAGLLLRSNVLDLREGFCAEEAEEED